MIQARRHRGARRARPARSVPISRAEIVNQWSLWWGVTMMVVGSLVSLLGRPRDLQGPVRNAQQEGATATDVLKHIEFPLWISAVGVPIFSVLGAWVTHEFFGVPWLLAFISLPLIFVLTVICTNSMALTSWTPTGALSKITQFTMGAIDRTNPASNLIPAGHDRRDRVQRRQPAVRHQARLHAGRASRASRRSGHVIGIFAGAICLRAAVLPALPAARRERRALDRDDGLRPVRVARGAAVEGRGRADRQGRERLCPIRRSSRWSWRRSPRQRSRSRASSTKGRFPLSAVSIGLGVVLPPEATFAMWVGAHDLLVDGPAPQGQGHARPRVLGRRAGADLRRADLRRGADGHRQRDRQRADELRRGPLPCSNVERRASLDARQ